MELMIAIALFLAGACSQSQACVNPELAKGNPPASRYAPGGSAVAPAPFPGTTDEALGGV